MKFVKVNDNMIEELANLASEIWHEYWVQILAIEQIEYMVEKFQSFDAIKTQIACENYNYYFIKYNDESIGYFGISFKKDYLFLSKLYIKKSFRHMGLGTKTFEKIKDICIKNNHDNIKLTVNKYNENTIKSYKKWGFKIIESVLAEIGNGFVMDDYIMQYKIRDFT